MGVGANISRVEKGHHPPAFATNLPPGLVVDGERPPPIKRCPILVSAREVHELRRGAERRAAAERHGGSPHPWPLQQQIQINVSWFDCTPPSHAAPRAPPAFTKLFNFGHTYCTHAATIIAHVRTHSGGWVASGARYRESNTKRGARHTCTSQARGHMRNMGGRCTLSRSPWTVPYRSGR